MDHRSDGAGALVGPASVRSSSCCAVRQYHLCMLLGSDVGDRRAHLRPFDSLPRNRSGICDRTWFLYRVWYLDATDLQRPDVVDPARDIGAGILAGVGVCMLAIAVSGLAGYSKEHEISSEDRAEAGERDFSFGKGLAVAIFAGIMSSCFAYGLAAGKPIAEIARVQLLAEHRLDLWQNLPVLVVVLWGGFFTNFVWSLFLIVKNHSLAQFAGAPGINPMGAGTAADEGAGRLRCAWSGEPSHRSDTGKELHSCRPGRSDLVLPILLLFHGADKDGQVRLFQLDAAYGEHHHLCHPLGVARRSGKGTSRRTKGLVALGLFLLVGSTVVVGYGNYLKVR